MCTLFNSVNYMQHPEKTLIWENLGYEETEFKTIHLTDERCNKWAIRARSAPERQAHSQSAASQLGLGRNPRDLLVYQQASDKLASYFCFHTDCTIRPIVAREVLMCIQDLAQQIKIGINFETEKIPTRAIHTQ